MAQQSTNAPRRDDAWQPPADETSRRPPSESQRSEVDTGSNRDLVERDELAPIGEGDEPDTSPTARYDQNGEFSTGGFTGNIWQGLDVDTVETLLNEIKPPPRSPALHSLWRKTMTANSPPPTGRSSDAFAAVRARALYRAGLLRTLSDWLKNRPQSRNGVAQSVLTLFEASADLGLGNDELACRAAQKLSGSASSLPDALKGDAILITGYCAAANGNTAAAGLAAELASEAGLPDSEGLSTLRAIAAATKPTLNTTVGRLTLIDYRILQAADARPKSIDVTKLKPPVLIAIANDAKADPIHRLLAAEAAFDINAVRPETVAKIYRDTTAIGEAKTREQQDAIQRAKSYTAAQVARDGNEKIKFVSSYLKAAAQSPFYDSCLRLAFDVLVAMEPGPANTHFSDAAILLALTAHAPKNARLWADTPTETGRRNDSANWFGLIDIAGGGSMPIGAGIRSYAEPEKFGGSMAALESMALRGAFKPELLHKLVTVLDALSYQVPIPLWDAASQASQPTGGYLPPTGVLSQLGDAAKQGEVGKVVLLAMKAIGPGGPRNAHMISLGDTVRALKRVGLVEQARQLGVEALLPDWPYQSRQ
ncbi:MAG: hypothetical protein ACRBCJ_10800 [Hyphomicrobiaceae bacterium]